MVYGYRANAERLPFNSEWFDCYVSSLCLHLVSNPGKMITEAARVLKTQGKACFTVWGRPEHTLYHHIGSIARQNLGMPIDPKTLKPFELEANIDQIKELMQQAGFTEIKHWFQAMNLNIRTGFDFVNCRPEFMVDRPLTDEETLLRNEMSRVFDDMSGKGSHNLQTFEIMVILASKD